MSAIIREKCPICGKEYEEDSEKYYRHLKIHLIKNVKENILRYLKRNPWYVSYHNARSRCIYPYGPYFNKGIKFLMTIEDFKYLWFRDKAYLMKKPSIDRINNKGDYILKNCHYIELSKNALKRNLRIFESKVFCLRGHLFEGNNIYIDPRGKRICKKCRNIRNKIFTLKKNICLIGLS